MNSNFHLLFYLRKQKNYNGGPMAVYMRITVDGKRVEMSAGRECDPAKWNSHAGRAIGAKEEIKSLNNYLDSLLTKVRNAHQVLIDANQRITTESLQNQFTGKTEKSLYLEITGEEKYKMIGFFIGLLKIWLPPICIRSPP